MDSKGWEQHGRKNEEETWFWELKVKWGKKKESSEEGESEGRVENDGILSELKCDVRGCDGSVNSNKSHILCLVFGPVRVLWTLVKASANCTGTKLSIRASVDIHPYILYFLLQHHLHEFPFNDILFALSRPPASAVDSFVFQSHSWERPERITSDMAQMSTWTQSWIWLDFGRQISSSLWSLWPHVHPILINAISRERREGISLHPAKFVIVQRHYSDTEGEIVTTFPVTLIGRRKLTPTNGNNSRLEVMSCCHLKPMCRPLLRATELWWASVDVFQIETV